MAAKLCIFLHQQICWDFSTNRHHLQVYSLRHRRGAQRDLFWVPNGIDGLLEVALSTGQSWRVLQSWYTASGPEQGFLGAVLHAYLLRNKFCLWRRLAGVWTSLFVKSEEMANKRSNSETRENFIKSEHIKAYQCRMTIRTVSCMQLFRERLSQKVHTTIPKGIVGGFEFTVLSINLKECYDKPWTFACVC